MLQRTLSPAEAAGRSWDVVVIGAGPAGASAALQLSRRGAAVLLVDRSSFPRSKVCGCCISASALGSLRRLGLERLCRDAGGRRLETMRLAARRREATLRLPGGMALSRRRFDGLLVAEAIEAGACFMDATSAAVVSAGGRWRRVDLTSRGTRARAGARLVLVAAGLRGRALGDGPTASVRVSSRSPMGAAASFDPGPGFYRGGTIHMACGDGGYVGVVRMEGDRLQVAAALDPHRVHREGGIGVVVGRILNACGWPVPDGASAARWEATCRLTRRRIAVAGQRLFFLGDAAEYVEPFTGEGMACALESAEAVVPLAAAAIAHWRTGLADAWMRRHRRLFRLRHDLCRLVTAALRRPLLTAAVIRILGPAPGLAQPLVRTINASVCPR